MPEGPEVKVLVSELNKKLKNKTLINVDILTGRYTKKKPDNFDNFIENLPLKILEIKNRGKFIYFILEKNWFIFNTLGLTGNWTIIDKIKHNRLAFKFENNNIFYNDVRNFGTLKFLNDPKILDKKLKTLGNDILENDFTEKYVINIFKNGKIADKTIAEILMKQTLFSGLGNYLKSEILYESKISPHRLIKDLSLDDQILLYKNIKKISLKFFKEGSAYKTSLGETNEDFVDNNFQVYKKKIDKNNFKIKRETTKDKRTTFWVEELQI